MKTVPVTPSQRSAIRASHSMTSYLQSLAVGRPETPHSWLYENRSTDEILDAWEKILHRVNKASPYDEIFTPFDVEKRKKCGPQGKIPPFNSPEVAEVLEPLYAASSADAETALRQYFPEAERFAREIFGSRVHSCKRKDFDKVVEDMQQRDTLTTNSGYPNFRRRSIERKVAIADAESGSALQYPAILLFRQYRGKLRPVWMYPMALNLLEYQFSQQIQDALRHSPRAWVQRWISPWTGYEQVKETLTKQYKSHIIVGGDTTKMDAHMRPAQLRLVFEIVKHLFVETEWEQLYRVIMQVNTIDLLVSPTQRLTGIHGLASGSGWTQLTETILIMFLAWLNGFEGQGIGDDFILLADLSADELVELLDRFLLPANPEKQTIAEDYTTFLQRLNHRNYYSRDNKKVLGGYYSTVWALNSMLQPEKFHKPSEWNKDMFCTRIYMILENTVDDPAFPEFAKFVVRGHQSLIPFAKKSAADLLEIQKAARCVPGLFPSYNQEKKDKPLSEFTSVKFVRDNM